MFLDDPVDNGVIVFCTPLIILSMIIGANFFGGFLLGIAFMVAISGFHYHLSKED